MVRAPGTLESAATAALQGAYSRAGLGPWTQLADRGRRLQLLSVMGRDEEALANAELVASKQARGAPHELAWSWFNDYFPLASLERQWGRPAERPAPLDLSARSVRSSGA